MPLCSCLSPCGCRHPLQSVAPPHHALRSALASTQSRPNPCTYFTRILPVVVVTPLSSKLPQPLLLFSSAVICRAVASSAPKVHSLHPLVPRAFYPAVVVTPLSSKLPNPLRLSPSAAICRVFESSAPLVHLLLRNRVPTHAVLQRAFYPAVVVTPLSFKLPLSCIAIRCAVASCALLVRLLLRTRAPTHAPAHLFRTHSIS